MCYYPNPCGTARADDDDISQMDVGEQPDNNAPGESGKVAAHSKFAAYAPVVRVLVAAKH